MNRQIFGTGIQHVEQGHLAVGIHLVNMDHIPVAQKLYDIIIGCVGIQATHAQHTKKEIDSQVVSQFFLSHKYNLYIHAKVWNLI